MKVTIDWLKDFVDFDLSAEELANKLTMVGLEVEEIIMPKREFNQVIIGKVIDLHPIAAASHLYLCQVNIGREIITTVCGAPNVGLDQFVPVAVPGAELPGNIIVEKRDFDGYTSYGMICSEAELGLSDRGDGIMILANSATAGMNLLQYLGEGSPTLAIAITPNRPDCLSVMGIAREVASLTKSKLVKPVVQFPEKGANVGQFITVVIRDAEKCPRYCGRYFSNVTIAPSPWWLVERLQAVGLRSINNIVDSTNYVMMETGHPLHAFDYDLIEDKKIIIKTARAGDTFTTLDEKRHKLADNSLMICDGRKAVALGGIMGGLNSEITENTHNIFLESAYFEPVNLRITAKRLGISTESSLRFERGADPENAFYAINRAAQLFHDLADATVARGVLDCYPKKIAPRIIPVRPRRVNQVLGTNLTTNEMKETLSSIELEVEDNDGLNVTVPTFRPDLTREIDLIEEIARLYGYDNIGAEVQPRVYLLGEKNPIVEFQGFLRHILMGMGFNEVVTLSMLNAKIARPFLAQGSQLIQIRNPLSEDLAVMRPSLVPSLLQIVAYNRNRQITDLNIFEVGDVYCRNEGDTKFSPIEQKKITGICTGTKFPASWHHSNKKLDYYDVKGYISHLLHRLNLEIQFRDNDGQWVDEHGATIYANGNYVGVIGALQQKLAEIFDFKAVDLFIFELDFDTIYQAFPKVRKYQTVSKYPSVPFDLAVIVDSNTRYAEIDAVIRQYGGPHLSSVYLFDTFEGKQIPEGKKSMAFTLSFSSMERTLGIAEVNNQVNEILNALNKRFNAYLRPQ